MSSTRYAKEGDPIHLNRWASSPEYAEQRGIPAGIALAKAGLQPTARKRRMIFFLQAQSIKPGGFHKLAEDLVAEFPDRLANPTDRARAIAALPDFLTALCADPQVKFSDPSDPEASEDQRRIERYWGYSAFAGCQPATRYISNLMGTLFEYESRYAEKSAKDFVMTTVAKEVFARLDKVLSRGKMVVIEGLEGRGKTEAAKAWCDQHLGVARYVDLTGNNNLTSFYRGISRALGLASGDSVKTTQMQSRIEDFLPRSGLVLVIDEAHFCFSSNERCDAPPKIIDWIDTALVNRGVKVALITTPQFVDRMNRVAKGSGWNVGQFKRRIVDWKPLPTKLTGPDLEAVARKLAPHAKESVIKYLAGFAGSQKSNHQLDTLVNTIQEAKFIAEQAGRALFTYEDMKQAIFQEIIPTALAKSEVFADEGDPKTRRVRPAKATPEPTPKGICKPLKEPLQAPCNRFESPSPEKEEEGAGDLHNRLFTPSKEGALC